MSDSWKSPATIIAIVTVLVSVCGNVFQYYNYKLDQEKWQTEKQAIDQQSNELRQRLNVFLEQQRQQEARRTELKRELDSLTEQISSLTKEITGANNIAAIAVARSLLPDISQEEKDEAIYRAEAARDRARSLAEKKEVLIASKTEKEKSYNISVFKD